MNALVHLKALRTAKIDDQDLPCGVCALVGRVVQANVYVPGGVVSCCRGCVLPVVDAAGPEAGVVVTVEWVPGD